MQCSIYYNPRCQKCRTALEQLNDNLEEPEIIEYLKTPPNAKEIKKLLGMLGISAEKLIRKKEGIWMENFKDKKLSEKQLIDAMVKYPVLIERPIIIKGNKAWIARNEETLQQILR